MRQNDLDMHSYPACPGPSTVTLPHCPDMASALYMNFKSLLAHRLAHNDPSLCSLPLSEVIRLAGLDPGLSKRGGCNHAGVWGPVLRALGMMLRTVPSDGISVDRPGSVLWLFVPQNHDPFERWLNPRASVVLDLSAALVTRAESFRVRLGNDRVRRIDMRKKIGRHTFSGWWACTGITSPEKPTHIFRPPTEDLPAYLQEIHTWRKNQSQPG